jgi:hypothetical protein
LNTVLVLASRTDDSDVLGQLGALAFIRHSLIRHCAGARTTFLGTPPILVPFCKRISPRDPAENNNPHDWFQLEGATMTIKERARQPVVAHKPFTELVGERVRVGQT